jgi:hypothetical protein
MNVLHVLDFHKEWVEMGLVQPKDFNFNICQGPDWYRIDTLPEQFKREVVVPAYEKHLEWLRPQDKLERASNGYASAINFMLAEDKSNVWPKFVAETKKLDNVRGEDFWATFPELSGLRDYEPT